MRKKLVMAMGIVATTGMLMTGCGVGTADVDTGAVGAVGSGVENMIDAIEETTDEDGIIEEEAVMDEFETSENTEPEPTADAAGEEVESTAEVESEAETDIDPTETAGEMVEKEVVAPEGEEATETTETEVELPTDYTDGNTEGTILGKQMRKATDGLKKIIDKARN